MAETDERRVLSWQECADLCGQLVTRIRAGTVEHDLILAISRGGLVPGALVSTMLDQRAVLSAALSSYDGDERSDTLEVLHFPTARLLRGRSVLVVDDVWDSGRTAVTVRDRVRSAGGTPTVAVLHYKPGRSSYPDQQPDLWVERTEDWIVYPWEATEGADAP